MWDQRYQAFANNILAKLGVIVCIVREKSHGQGKFINIFDTSESSYKPCSLDSHGKSHWWNIFSATPCRTPPGCPNLFTSFVPSGIWFKTRRKSKAWCRVVDSVPYAISLQVHCTSSEIVQSTPGKLSPSWSRISRRAIRRALLQPPPSTRKWLEY